MSNESQFSKDYSLVSELFASALVFLLKLLIPKLIFIGVILLIVIISIISILTMQEKAKSDIKLQVFANAQGFNSEGLKQEFLTINGQKYGLPLIKDKLNKTELKLLMAIRGAEFETRQENNLAGDRDSVGAYQQRVSELLGNNYLANKTREVLGENVYNSVFHPKRIEQINQSKNTQLRNISHSMTQDYMANPAYYNTDACQAGHKGIDISHKTGDLVTSVEAGEVIDTTFDLFGGGNVVIIKHKSIYSLYAHMNEFLVKKGDFVRAGQIIGHSGNTGVSTGSHLHFQLMQSIDKGWNCDAINPNLEPFLLSTQLSPFLALALELTQIHLQTGLFDMLALERLKKEPTTSKFFNGDTFTDEDIIEGACRSQRPIEYINGRCIEQGWKERARQVISSLS